MLDGKTARHQATRQPHRRRSRRGPRGRPRFHHHRLPRRRDRRRALYIADTACVVRVALYRARKLLDSWAPRHPLCYGDSATAPTRQGPRPGRCAVALATASLIAIGCQNTASPYWPLPVGITTRPRVAEAARRRPVGPTLANFYAATCREVAVSPASTAAMTFTPSTCPIS